MASAAGALARVSAAARREIQFGDGRQVAAHLLVLLHAEQLRYFLFDLAHRRFAGCDRGAASLSVEPISVAAVFLVP